MERHGYIRSLHREREKRGRKREGERDRVKKERN
jgi:hypothetical protein